MKTLKQIQQFSKKNNFELQDKSILVACSGGVDSMVLTDILSKLDNIKKIGIAHCNFSLRADESDGDEKFIRNYAKEKNIDFHSIKFNTKKLAEEKQKSIQLIARELRYDFFEKISSKEGYEFVATAHHLSDSLETSLYHLSKGSGISGLRGIVPKRSIYKNSQAKIIRPLLCLTKQEILNYAKENNLKWREDASNQTEKYKRNFIRHQIVPKLKDINPDTEKTFLDTSERLRAMENLLRFHLKTFEKTLSKREDKSILIRTETIRNIVEPLLIVSEFLKKYGFSYKQSKQILEQLDSQDTKSKTFFAKSHTLFTNQEEWILRDKNDKKTNFEEIEIDFNDNGKYLIKNKKDKTILTLEKQNADKADFKSKSMYVDAHKLKFPLMLRKWQNGDRFIPLGMRNSKTIGNFLTDLKIPIYQRDFVYILESDKTIFWVGIIEESKVEHLRIGEKYRLESNSKYIMKIS
ncbi:tRNA lysidine(34) synthetase TilS [Bernardetia sp.]|uniref:tRNA lysidine(34) synthetase TilS n=1 Tax=Bernardetia sp. TaxID=1937974 RepID=UPI0025C2A4C2|nr:tRNA lysidine(34) synthetase TilS [Bernardetia sp.]